MKLKNIILLIIGLGVFVYILTRMDVNIAEVIKSIKSPQYVVLAAIVLAAIPLINAFRMRFIISPIEKKILSMHVLFVIEYIHKFITNVMPFKLNLPAKAMLLNKKCGMQLSSGVSVVSFEYMLDSSITTLFGFLGAFAYFRNDTRISFVSIEYFIAITFICTVAFFSIPTEYFGKLLNHAEYIHMKIIRTITASVFKLLWAIRGTWAKLILHREIIKVLIATAIIWGSTIFVNEFLFLSTGLYVSPTWILVATSSGIFIGGISMIPGGLGVREATMVLLYGYLGVPNEASVSVVLLSRILNSVPIIIGYIYSIKIGYDEIMQYRMDTNL